MQISDLIPEPANDERSDDLSDLMSLSGDLGLRCSTRKGNSGERWVVSVYGGSVSLMVSARHDGTYTVEGNGIFKRFEDRGAMERTVSAVTRRFAMSVVH